MLTCHFSPEIGFPPHFERKEPRFLCFCGETPWALFCMRVFFKYPPKKAGFCRSQSQFGHFSAYGRHPISYKQARSGGVLQGLLGSRGVRKPEKTGVNASSCSLPPSPPRNVGRWGPSSKHHTPTSTLQGGKGGWGGSCYACLTAESFVGYLKNTLKQMGRLSPKIRKIGVFEAFS